MIYPVPDRISFSFGVYYPDDITTVLCLKATQSEGRNEASCVNFKKSKVLYQR